MSKNSLVSSRDVVVEQLRLDLIGPVGGAEEIVVGKPAWRYLAGILFPRDVDGLFDDEEDEQDPTAVGGSDEGSDPAIAAAYDMLPASMGISFYLEGAHKLIVESKGAKYKGVALADLKEELEEGCPDTEREEAIRVLMEQFADPDELGNSPGLDDSNGSQQRVPSRKAAELWSRRSCVDSGEFDETRFAVPETSRASHERHSTLTGAAEVSARFRPFLNGHLVTVTLINMSPKPEKGAVSEVEAMLFQSKFRVRIETGTIGAYPDLQQFSRHPEDEELVLAYRDRRAHGIGHGCAATWDSSAVEGGLRAISAEPLPSFEVKALTNRIALDPAASKGLDVRWLADPSLGISELESVLNAFVGSYDLWVTGQGAVAHGMSQEQRSVAERMIERQREAVVRMRRGIQQLVEDKHVRESFRLAQEAMFRQFVWVENRKAGPFDVGMGKSEFADPMTEQTAKGPQWYPFQLAFQLLVLEGLADPKCDSRSAVDLLWFPTGGGKTEAYLALAAFEMIHRRRRYCDDGTAVLMRYTLRLLTSQQFERCTTLVAVLESMRRTDPECLGTAPFRLGLWVGGQLTPNRLDNDDERSPGASQWIERLLEAEEPENPFLLRSCPRCGTRIVPLRKSADRSHYGVEADASAFKFLCPDQKCIFHDEIPASVVDDDLFRNPPTFLIGTIDKFARMVWDARSRVFLGRGREDVLPPSLIIQDELHLINGPLGSIAGGYEAALETVINLGGARPKYIASTATIQRAHEQCRALYGRDAFVFPPSGLAASDSFFSREDKEAPGRTYLGVMGNGLYSSLTTLVQVSAAAAHAPKLIPASEETARDSYWTQVIYHNSRQELGKTMTMLRDDVRTRLQILEPDSGSRREFETVEELSANIKGSAVGEALERLQVGLPDEGVIDAVACTNMISVGVDVSRLGLMVVKGQPKSTAEYIQATSRVGRDLRNRPPGVVMTIYTPLRPRDRSHFEGFQAYHHALYRAVEPSSVTPYSAPARERTLHAALVLTLRHVLAWEEGRDARKFDPDSQEQKDVINALEARILSACREDEREETREHLAELIERWSQEASAEGLRPLTFDPKKQFRSLLTTFPRDEGPEGFWPTLNSMRHVDGETGFEIRGQEKASGRGSASDGN